MTTKTTKKKTTAKKSTAVKAAAKPVVKTETVKPAAKKAVVKTTVKKAPVKKAEVAQVPVKKEPIAVVETKKEAPQKKKNTYEISPFFHAIIVFIIVLLYAEMTFLGVLYFNYEVTIESKAAIDARYLRRLEQLKRPRRLRQVKNVRRVSGNVKRAVPVFKCPEPVERKAVFVEAEYAPYAIAGSSVIEGSACFKLEDGSEKCFANAEVFINPVTSYSDEWYNRGWAGREFLAPADARVLPFNKRVRTDKDGAFKFTDLAPGSYYVGAAVCLPKAKDAKGCRPARFAKKVQMKSHVKTTLDKVYP